MAKEFSSNESSSGGLFDLSINVRGILLILLVLGGAGVQIYQTQQSLALNTDIANSQNLIAKVEEGILLMQELQTSIKELFENQQTSMVNTLANLELESNVTYTVILAKFDEIELWFKEMDDTLQPIRESKIPLPVNYEEGNPIAVSKSNYSEFVNEVGGVSSNEKFILDYNFQPVEYKILEDLLIKRDESPSFKAVSEKSTEFNNLIILDREELKTLTDTLFSNNFFDPGTFTLLSNEISVIQGRIRQSLASNTTTENREYNADFALELSSLQSNIDSLSLTTSQMISALLLSPVSELNSIVSAWDLSIDLQEKQFEAAIANMRDGFGSEATRPEDLTSINTLENLLLLNNSKGLIPVLNRTKFVAQELVGVTENLQTFLKIDVPKTTGLIEKYGERTTVALQNDLTEFKASFANFYFLQTTLSILVNVGVIIILAIATVVVIPLLRTIIGLTRKLDKGFGAISRKDLNVEKFEDYAGGEIGRIQQGYDIMVGELRKILLKLQGTSHTLSEIAESMAASSQEASASINQVSDTISTIALGASHQTEAMNRIAESLNSHLEEVQTLSDRIQETSEFVKKVAKRTNILGLNASIEAAKAGHFGGGFSVVAENVRELSEDTKGSANEISELIEDVSFKINRTIQAVMNEVTEMKEITENTAAGSEEANASSSEQVSMLSEISEKSAEISRIASELDRLMRDFNF